MCQALFYVLLRLKTKAALMLDTKDQSCLSVFLCNNVAFSSKIIHFTESQGHRLFHYSSQGLPWCKTVLIIRSFKFLFQSRSFEVFTNLRVFNLIGTYLPNHIKVHPYFSNALGSNPGYRTCRVKIPLFKTYLLKGNLQFSINSYPSFSLQKDSPSSDEPLVIIAIILLPVHFLGDIWGLRILQSSVHL